MNTQVTTQNNAVTQCVNKTIADDFIRRYQSSTKNALENILCMGEAVNEIYQKVKSKELDNSDLEYFCRSVHLDPKGSTFRKYKSIGENVHKFRMHIEKLPSTFSVLYEMATLSGDDFEKFVIRANFSKGLTLEEFKRIIKKSTILSKNKLYNPPVSNIARLSVAKVIKRTNNFSISIVRDLTEAKFNEIVDVLTEFRNKGWIQFDDPIITQYLMDESEPQDLTYNSQLLV